MPSQPRWPTFAMNSRRLGVSTIWAMFSRVTSKTSGSSCSSRKRSTSSLKSSCSGEKSKFTSVLGSVPAGGDHRHERHHLAGVPAEVVGQRQAPVDGRDAALLGRLAAQL